MSNKLNKPQKWAHDLRTGVIKLWQPSHTKSLLTAVRNTSKRYSAGDVQALLDTGFEPIQVDEKHEAKARKFWQSNCMTSKGAWRDTAFTRVLGRRERDIIEAYLKPNSQGMHLFTDIRDITSGGQYSYFEGAVRSAIPVWCISAVTPKGVRFFNYSYGNWQSGTLLEIVG